MQTKLSFSDTMFTAGGIVVLVSDILIMVLGSTALEGIGSTHQFVCPIIVAIGYILSICWLRRHFNKQIEKDNEARKKEGTGGY